MSKFFLASLVIGASFVLASCGGGGGSSAPSPFEGHFVGSWTEDGPDIGTADVTVASNGETSGSVDDTTASQSGPVSGKIHSNGTFNGQVVFSTGTITCHGTWTLSQDGQTLSGIVTNTSGSGTNTVDYSLTKQ